MGITSMCQVLLHLVNRKWVISTQQDSSPNLTQTQNIFITFKIGIKKGKYIPIDALLFQSQFKNGYLNYLNGHGFGNDAIVERPKGCFYT